VHRTAASLLVNVKPLPCAPPAGRAVENAATSVGDHGARQRNPTARETSDPPRSLPPKRLASAPRAGNRAVWRRHGISDVCQHTRTPSAW
jgi:hypothetical protein